MLITKAIQLFKLHLEHSDQLDHHDMDDAVKLGIEALTVCHRLQQLADDTHTRLLPSETIAPPPD